MLFKRREPPSWLERLRIALWPRRSWRRSTQYIFNRISRLRGTPHTIAIGCAVGAFVSCTPYLGFHFIIAGLLAWILGGSIIASALGTFFGNPITFPLIWLSTFKSGCWLLGIKENFEATSLKLGFKKLWEGIGSFSLDIFIGAMETLWPFLKPMTVGAVPLGLIVGIGCYYFARKMVEAYQMRRPSPTNTAQSVQSERQGTLHI